MRLPCSESSFHFFLPHVEDALSDTHAGFARRFLYLHRSRVEGHARECVFCGVVAVPFTDEEVQIARAAYLALPAEKRTCAPRAKKTRP